MKTFLMLLLMIFGVIVTTSAQASIYKDEWVVFNGKAYYVKNAAEDRQVTEMIRAEMKKGQDFEITFAKVQQRGGQTITCETKGYYSARWEEFKQRWTDCLPGDPRPY